MKTHEKGRPGRGMPGCLGVPRFSRLGVARPSQLPTGPGRTRSVDIEELVVEGIYSSRGTLDVPFVKNRSVYLGVDA